MGPSGFDKIRHEAEITLNYISVYIQNKQKIYTNVQRKDLEKFSCSKLPNSSRQKIFVHTLEYYPKSSIGMNCNFGSF